MYKHRYYQQDNVGRGATLVESTPEAFGQICIKRLKWIADLAFLLFYYIITCVIVLVFGAYVNTVSFYIENRKHACVTIKLSGSVNIFSSCHLKSYKVNHCLLEE